MQVKGRIKVIGQVVNVSESFSKRDLVVTTEEQYPQHITIQFNKEKCDLLNSFQIGQQVEVGINLRGREWTNPQGETRYFNSIEGWKINLQGQQQGQAMSQTNSPQSFQQPNQNQTVGFQSEQQLPF